ncbi:MAG: M20/M25/M40 family metallo-hydrolase [Erysipelotrichaceae bacterium]|nr:M20/M25/M40 family metallo-hydrolase [Erysipelotrichaceae bacterium]
MIGLDNMRFIDTDVTCSGSQKITLCKKIDKEDKDGDFYVLKIQGLLGGHSANFIDAERANSIKLTARILNDLNKDLPLQIAYINGGDKDNAIPVYCETLFTAKTNINEVKEKITSLFDDLKEEFADSDKDITVTVEEGNKEKVLSVKDSESLLKYLLILPNGLRHKSMVLEGLTTASENLANIRISDDEIVIRYFIRAALFSHLDEMANEIVTICDLFGFESKLETKSPGWTYVKDSPLRNKLFEIFEKHTGLKMKERPTHGGLETAFISYGIPGIDIACLGADVADYHTVRESLDLKTFRQAYEILKDLLSQL